MSYTSLGGVDDRNNDIEVIGNSNSNININANESDTNNGNRYNLEGIIRIIWCEEVQEKRKQIMQI